MARPRTRRTKGENNDDKENVANEKRLTIHIPIVSNLPTETREVLIQHYPSWHPIYSTKDILLYDYADPKKPIYAEGPYDEQVPILSQFYQGIYTNLCALNLKMEWTWPALEHLFWWTRIQSQL